MVSMKAFVIMPFDQKYDDLYKIGIKETINSEDLIAYRLDEQIIDEGMLERIYNEIQSADFLIADLTERNPNVFYELGYAHGIGKRTILLTQNADNIPFDLKHKRHIVYDSLCSLKENLRVEVDWLKNDILQNIKIPIDVQLKSDGSLTLDEFYAEANLSFQIDIENLSDKKSIEINAIYLHSQCEWEVYQDERSLSYKRSSHKGFKYKYQLLIDNPRIPKSGWMALHLDSKRILASVIDGDELKDSYVIQGKIIIDVETTIGDITRTLPLNVHINNLPF